MAVEHHRAEGFQGGDDVVALVDGDLCSVVVEGAAWDSGAQLEWSEALKLGEWLIAQAIARGAQAGR